LQSAGTTTISWAFLSHTSENATCIIYDMFTHMDRKAHVACNFNYLLENEGLLRVKASHVHCKCALHGNISKTFQIESLLLQITNRK